MINNNFLIDALEELREDIQLILDAAIINRRQREAVSILIDDAFDQGINCMIQDDDENPSCTMNDPSGSDEHDFCAYPDHVLNQMTDDMPVEYNEQDFAGGI